MGDHHDADGNKRGDRADREEMDANLAAADWNRDNVSLQRVDLDRMPDTTRSHVEDHAHDVVDLGYVEDGVALREFTDEGHVDQGRFGDGAFIPDHWWSIANGGAGPVSG